MKETDRIPAVTVYTLVHNTGAYLPQCIESVLNQTFTDWHYVLLDNASTDGSADLIESYAERDARVELVRYEENLLYPRWVEEARRSCRSPYVAVLDSDDWWEPDYLESLLGFLRDHELDLAVTGTVCYYEETGESKPLRRLPERKILSRQAFAENFPAYWAYTSTFWACVMRTELVRRMDLASIELTKLANTGDTICMLKYLEQCGRIGIDATVLQHYRIRPRQASRSNYVSRVFCNLCLYDTVLDFFRKQGVLSEVSRRWAEASCLKQFMRSLQLLRGASLSPGEKAAEYLRVVSHPATRCVELLESRDQRKWHLLTRTAALEAILQCPAFDETCRALTDALFPACAAAVTQASLPLFRSELLLTQSLLNDDRVALLTALAGLSVRDRYKDAPVRPMMNALLLRELRRAVRCRQEGRLSDCRAVLDALRQTGVPDSGELSALSEKLAELEKRGKS